MKIKLFSEKQKNKNFKGLCGKQGPFFELKREVFYEILKIE